MFERTLSSRLQNRWRMKRSLIQICNTISICAICIYLIRHHNDSKQDPWSNSPAQPEPVNVSHSPTEAVVSSGELVWSPLQQILDNEINSAQRRYKPRVFSSFDFAEFCQHARVLQDWWNMFYESFQGGEGVQSADRNVSTDLEKYYIRGFPMKMESSKAYLKSPPTHTYREVWCSLLERVR